MSEIPEEEISEEEIPEEEIPEEEIPLPGAGTPEAGLLPSVIDYLNITWDITNERTNLLGIIRRGMAYLDRLAGHPLDYETHHAGMQLLLDYCRYVRSEALDVFQTNYLHERMALPLAEGATVYAQGEPTAE